MITERFFKIWEYPPVIIDEDYDNDEDYTIYNSPDPRHKKLDYFIFRDEKIETEEIAKMYYHVIKKLMEENPAAFNHPDIKQTISLTSNNQELRTPYELISGYFIEANIDNNAKFRKLRYLLNYFNLQDDLLINFSNKDFDNSDNEISSRDFWDEKASSEALNITDSCIKIINEINPQISHNYTHCYIGLNKNNKANNFVFFVPKQSFVRAEVLVSESNKWSQELTNSGFKVNSIGKRS
jgi:hypothetical protein